VARFHKDVTVFLRHNVPWSTQLTAKHTCFKESPKFSTADVLSQVSLAYFIGLPQNV